MSQDRRRRAARAAAWLVGAGAGAGALALVGFPTLALASAASPSASNPPSPSLTVLPPPVPTVAITSPAGGSSGGQAVVTSSEPTIAGRATPGDQNGLGSIQSPVQVDIVSLAGHPASSSFTLAARSAVSGGRTWAFSGTPTSPLGWNGAYQVSVTAKETDCCSLGTTSGTATAKQAFSVAAPPIAPRGVTATVVGGGVQAKGAAGAVRAGSGTTTSTTSSPGAGSLAVQVSWTGNPEPDLTGYAVLRSIGSGGFAPLATTVTPGYRDSRVVAGQTYRYAVVAQREGATSTQTVSSSPSATSPLVIGAAGSKASSAAGPFTGLSNPTPPVLSLPTPAAVGGNSSAPSSTPALPAPVTGAPVYGNFQSVLPYVTLPGQGKKTGSSGSSVSVPSGTRASTGRVAVGGGLTSKSTPSSSSRARTFATVALAMILLAAAAHLRRLFKAVSTEPAAGSRAPALGPDEVAMAPEPRAWSWPTGKGRPIDRGWGRGA